MRLRGQIRLPPGAQPPPDPVLIVRVEDISEADAASKTRKRIEFPADSPGPYSFDFESPDVPHGAQWILSARLSSKGATKIAPADYLTTRAYMIRPGLPEQMFEIELTRAA